MDPLKKKEVLDALRLELSIIEGGGYGRSVRTPWRETTLFRDSITCLNVGEEEKKHPCGGCILIGQVPDQHLSDDMPCHHIPLNELGETIASLELNGSREEIESAISEWLKATIRRLEAEPDQG
jgi:hypothetical protein